MFCLCRHSSVNSIMGNPDVELIYFPIHGRGLVARLILDYGKADYNNKVLTFPEFGALKPSKFSKSIFEIKLLIMYHKHFLFDNHSIFSTSSRAIACA